MKSILLLLSKDKRERNTNDTKLINVLDKKKKGPQIEVPSSFRSIHPYNMFKVLFRH